MCRLLTRNVLALTVGAAATGLHGQAPTDQAPLTCEVASVKSNQSDSPFRVDCGPDGSGLTIRNVSLRMLIVTAYQVQPFQIEGPSWIGNERFDVVAKAKASRSFTACRSFCLHPR